MDSISHKNEFYIKQNDILNFTLCSHREILKVLGPYMGYMTKYIGNASEKTNGSFKMLLEIWPLFTLPVYGLRILNRQMFYFLLII